jgi:hypothetical protein
MTACDEMQAACGSGNCTAYNGSQFFSSIENVEYPNQKSQAHP